jgi:hypothetical protein
MYRHYHIQHAIDDKGQRRWIVDDALCKPDERGREGFETQEEVMDHVDKLMKESGKEHLATERMESEREKARSYQAYLDSYNVERTKKTSNDPTNK